MESYSIGKPNHKDAFKQDIITNIKKRTNNFTTNIYIDTLLQEAIMYSCDICLEFDRKAGFLSKDWILHVVSEVCDIFCELFHEFSTNFRNEVMEKVLVFMDMAKTQEGKQAVQDVITEFYQYKK